MYFDGDFLMVFISFDNVYFTSIPFLESKCAKIRRDIVKGSHENWAVCFNSAGV